MNRRTFNISKISFTRYLCAVTVPEFSRRTNYSREKSTYFTSTFYIRSPRLRGHAFVIAFSPQTVRKNLSRDSVTPETGLFGKFGCNRDPRSIKYKYNVFLSQVYNTRGHAYAYTPSLSLSLSFFTLYISRNRTLTY